MTTPRDPIEAPARPGTNAGQDWYDDGAVYAIHANCPPAACECGLLEAILAIEAEAARGAAPLLRSREEEMAIRMAKPIADLFGSLPAHDPATCRRCVPRAEGLPHAAIRASCEWVEENIAPKRCDNEGVADCWRCNTVFLARTLARLSRPSDERVPEEPE